MSQENPLLDTTGTPSFSAIRPEHVEPALRQRIGEFEQLLDRLMDAGGPYTWEAVVEPLDRAEEAIARAWGPVEHLNAVMNNDALREAYKTTKPLLTEHMAKVAQDSRLYRAIREVSDRADELGLERVPRRILENFLRDFRLAGVDLPDAKKDRYRQIQVELSDLSTTFNDNLIDVIKQFRLVLEDPKDVEGLPESLLAAARQKALDDDPQAPEHRWVFTLHAPSVVPFLQYQPKRHLREQLYRAYVTRATEAPHDNSPLIEKILALRAELAELLGFNDYAELSLATKMAESPSHVHGFLMDLAQRSKPFGELDKDALAKFAKEQDGVEALESYDVSYYRERLRQERYSFSDDEVRRYFPLPRVLEGLFETLRRLYGIKITEVTSTAGIDVWHPDVRVIQVEDKQGRTRGFMLMDLFARDGKRQGAWMGDCVERRRLGDGAVQLPVAYLVCNFAAPVGGKQALLRHDDVRTLFHETGHALHHVLTLVDYRKVSGINEVPWDGVELPSQFHENWVWQEEALGYLTGHAETGEPLPKELFEKMLAAKNFMSGADMLRQLEFSLFDLELHTAYRPGPHVSVHDVLQSVRDQVAVFRPPAYERFENGFTHIFAGGYAAGYYSYKWAEVLAADAFSRFEEEGLFSQEAGADFLTHVLEQGGSSDLMDLYVAFRGREPSPEALLRHSGLVIAGGDTA